MLKEVLLMKTEKTEKPDFRVISLGSCLNSTS